MCSLKTSPAVHGTRRSKFLAASKGFTAFCAQATTAASSRKSSAARRSANSAAASTDCLSACRASLSAPLPLLLQRLLQESAILAAKPLSTPQVSPAPPNSALLSGAELECSDPATDPTARVQDDSGTDLLGHICSLP